jgi:tetratricopeptide (TPR) repeat protein
MNRFCVSLICSATLAGLCAPAAIPGQVSETPSRNKTGAEIFSSLHGTVRDWKKRPVSGATVFLQSISPAGSAQALTVGTDANGAYCFSPLRAGTYTLRAEMPAYGKTHDTQVSIAQKEDKEVDLTLGSSGTLANSSSTTPEPEFLDEPHFTVAGVTDTTTMGGHGSSPTIIKNTESLVRDTASLAKQSATKPISASNDAVVETSLRKAVGQQPDSFAANEQLGKWLVDEERPLDAIAYLERASGINPNDDENRYYLALAHFKMAEYSYAQTELGSLLKAEAGGQEKAEAHHLLGETDEKLGDLLEAVRELQRAAELDPSEPNLFDWGSELLLHSAAEPAVEVFTKGNRLFPQSVRMLTALGASLYVLGSPEKAAQRLCEASDLNPRDPDPYLFMGKMQATEAIPPGEIAERLERFAKLHPENALANYYYAVSLWKARNSAGDQGDLGQIELLLTKAAQLDPKLGDAYLQMGMVYAEEKDMAKAIASYQQAITATPDLAVAHYHLAQAYRQQGESVKAQAEMELYEKISKANADEVETERRQTQQFVYQLKQIVPAAQPER